MDIFVFAILFKARTRTCTRIIRVVLLKAKARFSEGKRDGCVKTPTNTNTHRKRMKKKRTCLCFPFPLLPHGFWFCFMCFHIFEFHVCPLVQMNKPPPEYEKPVGRVVNTSICVHHESPFALSSLQFSPSFFFEMSKDSTKQKGVPEDNRFSQ